MSNNNYNSYNWKMKCVDLCGSNSDIYTVGKIYNVVNGVFKNDNFDNMYLGNPGYENDFTTFDDWNNFSNSEWELVLDEKEEIEKEIERIDEKIKETENELNRLKTVKEEREILIKNIKKEPTEEDINNMLKVNELLYDYNWFAKNGDGNIHTFIDKPYKNDIYNAWCSDGDVIQLKCDLSHLSWDDDEPYFFEGV